MVLQSLRSIIHSSAFLFGILALLSTPNVQGADLPAAHFEPQVAMLCDSKGSEGVGDGSFRSQYMTEAGRWTTDATRKVTCYKDKLDILDYCKKLSLHSSVRMLGAWSKLFARIHSPTNSLFWFSWTEGPFQSDALLVPENCLFDHIHNQTKCWEFDRWNGTAAQSCQDRDLQLRSFAMLLPCGISLFSGVEFVCCPAKADKSSVKKSMLPSTSISGSEVFDRMENADRAVVDDADGDDDDEDDDLDDEDDDDYDNYDDNAISSSSTTTTSTTTTTTTARPTTGLPTPDPYFTHFDPRAEHKAYKEALQRLEEVHREKVTKVMKDWSDLEERYQAISGLPTPDPYFTHFDPRAEHKAYKEALQRLEEVHREKVTKVMKDWSDLEERYQDMRSTDPRMAEEFKQRMTVRFQQTVQSLEEEGAAEKHQLVAMHQQRVMAHINQRKKEAMACYTQALNDNPPNTHRVQKCLQKLLRSLHKDRHHTIAHFRHLLSSSLEQAEREKALTLEHLVDIDHMVNQSLQMLDRYPDLATKIGQLMSDYIQALRSKDDTPGSLLSMTRDAEAAILDKYRAEVTAMQEDKERERVLEKQRKEQHKREREELKQRVYDGSAADAAAGDEGATTPTVAPPSPALPPQPPQVPQQHVVDPQPRVAHALAHDISHGEPTYSVRREVYHRETKSVFLTLAFAGMALMAVILITVTVLRRRSARLPQNQGFVEVDQAVTPEERHVANMQINGYENPTYKYFEVKE
ncbi:amyloid-beta-like protein [Nilaparvata lugens]|uniref:amyloid-beta-like protein n=1 Tax=Nilaparvata lugens TaxID=108931 RepID=UPI00193E5036|nr:amyloid-beta-like protein [Nilaparvata lugens]